MSLQLPLEKAATSLKMSLDKVGIHTPPSVEVAFFLDVSGSFDDEHRDGITDTLLTRLVPWGLLFDPDKKMDVFTFSNGAASVHEVGAINADNYPRFVQNKIIDKVPGYMGGTAYSHLVEGALKHFGWTATVKKAGFFGGLMGKKDEVIQGVKKRSLVIVATDGDNNESGDKERTMRVLRESQKRGDQVYYLFLGISNQGSTFPFLDKIGDAFNNTGYLNIKNLRKFVEQSDDDLNAQLLNDELISWLKG